MSLLLKVLLRTDDPNDGCMINEDLSDRSDVIMYYLK